MLRRFWIAVAEELTLIRICALRTRRDDGWVIDPTFLRPVNRDRIGKWIAMNATAWNGSSSNR